MGSVEKGLPPGRGGISHDRRMKGDGRIYRIVVVVVVVGGEVVEDCDDQVKEYEIPTLSTSAPGGMGWIEGDRVGEGHRRKSKGREEEKKEDGEGKQTHERMAGMEERLMLQQ